jgi:hypothetical protein
MIRFLYLFLGALLSVSSSACLPESESDDLLDEDAELSEDLEEVGTSQQALSSCYVSGVALNAWYSQNNPSWSSIKLGNSSTDTIGGYGCVISSLAMAYHDVWGVPTTPSQLNTSAKTAGCFGAGSSLVDVSCAINSRGGPHFVTDVSISSVATAICAGQPVMVDVTWGGGHKMLVYHYNGGSVSSKSSYAVVDPWDGTSKFLTSFTPTRWRKLQ